ncbi:MAG: helix-turn-helix transcriptional regulator [Alphaproteobacteria bacterium]|nr:helix-turn-helix transcriptional regulator [Alphaproteobacteria bacterium]
MLSHKQIWGAIDALAARHGHSSSGLARAAGLDPTTFNKSKRLGPEGRLRWPSTESLSKILQVTGASLDDFVSLVSRGGGAKAGSRMLPVLKMKEAAKKRVFDGDGLPVLKAWDRMAFPDLTDQGAFALEVSNDAAAPVYQIGDVVVISPDAEVRRGDRVVVKASDGVLVMRFVRQTAKRVELKSLNPSLPDRVVERAGVEWVARIVWARS